MTDNTEYKAQRFNFTKDGDDYIPRRPPFKKSSFGSSSKPAIKNCECGGKLKAKGATGVCGLVSSKCNKCGERVYSKTYKGVNGLVRCY